MLPNLKDLNKLRKQAKQMKKEMEKEIMIGTAENGKIQITMDGNQEIKKVKIENEILNPENKEKIEAGIQDAITQCLTQIQMLMAKKMQSGGLF